MVVEHPGVGVGGEAGGGADVAGVELHGEVRRGVQRPQVGVPGAGRGVADVPLVGGDAALEVRVHAGLGIPVDLVDAGVQAGGGDAELLREFVQRGALCEVAVGQEGRHGFGRCARAHHADAVLAQRGRIADQVGRHAAGGLHRHAEQVVRGAFVDEALAGLVDGEHAGLGAVHHEVREHGGAAVGAPSQGHRRPEGVAERALAVDRARAFRQRVGLGGVARRGRAPADVGAGQQLRTQARVAVEAAAGQHHAARDSDRAHDPGGQALPFELHAAHTRAVALEALDRGVERQRHVGMLGQRIQQPRDQRIAHHQPRAARVAQAVRGVAQDDPERVPEGRERLGERQQVVDVAAVHHHPAEHGEFGNRRTNQREEIAQQAAVERQRLQRAAVQRRAAEVGDVVRVFGAGAEPHFRAGLSQRHRFGTVIEESLA